MIEPTGKLEDITDFNRLRCATFFPVGIITICQIMKSIFVHSFTPNAKMWGEMRSILSHTIYLLGVYDEQGDTGHGNTAD